MNSTPQVGPRPVGFLWLKEAWQQLFVSRAAASKMSWLEPFTPPAEDDETAKRLHASLKEETVQTLVSAVRGKADFPRLVVWTRALAHAEPEPVDLHLMDDWQAHSVTEGMFFGPPRREYNWDYWRPHHLQDWPLFVRYSDWSALLSHLTESGPRPNAPRADQRARPPALPEAELTRWLESFCAETTNAHVPQMRVWQRIQVEYPEHFIARDRLIARLREFRPGTKPGPKPSREKVSRD